MPELIGVDASGLRDLSRLARDIDRLTVGGGMRRSLRASLREVGEVVAADARTRAAWSTRIPRSIKVSVTQRGVAVRAGGERAPHAAAYEAGDKGRGGPFRHPVFGNRNVWVEQDSRPYLMPALRSNLDRAAEMAADAIERAFRTHGWS